MDRVGAAARALASPAGQQAVRNGDAATLIRLVRESIGWRQSDLGQHSGYSQPTISRLEKGQGRITDLAVLAKLAEVLCIPRSAFGLADDSSAAGDRARTVVDVRRSEFLRGVVGTAAALTLPADIASGTARRIGAATIRDCQATLDRLYELDGRRGGTAVYALTTQMVTAIQSTLARASYSPGVGRGLRAVAATTAEHAGWLAFDSGQLVEARRWWLESLHLAEMADTQQLRVIAFASMALQACTTTDPADGREAVDLIDLARRAAGSDASPRLLSLLAARQALGYARGGDQRASDQGFISAERWLERSREDGSEPSWLSFWGTADLACHRARAALALGDAEMAKQTARLSLAECDSTRYPRNHAIYASLLATSQARSGQLDEAMATMAPVVPRVGAFGSRRILAETYSVLRVLEQRKDYRPAASFVSWARQLVPAA